MAHVSTSTLNAMAQCTRENEQQAEKIIGMLLSDMGRSYVAEWNQIYKSILNFVWDIFNTRQNMHCISLDGPG